MSKVRRIAPHLRALSAPEPLRALPGWLLWKMESYDGDPKPRKVPYYANGGRRYGQQGGPKDRANLTTFADARDAAVRLGFDGVGLAMLPDWQVTAIDVDYCVAPDGSLPPEIEAVVERTYAEYSPSGEGIRAFFMGNLGNHKSYRDGGRYGLETFASSGFVTFTGNILPHVDILGYENQVSSAPADLVDLCEARFGVATSSFDPDDFMAGREPRLGLTVDYMADLLSALDPDMGREDWIKVGMGLHHECEGDDTGFELWHEWSAEGGKYPSEEALRQQWDSFDRHKASGRKQVTMASVIKLAKDAGFMRPAEAATADTLRKVVEETADRVPEARGQHTPAGYDGKFPISRAALVANKPPAKWWIKGVIPEAQIGAIFGASGSGKSFVALDLMAHLSMGLKWRGQRTKTARGLYVAAEGGTGVGKRIKAWAQHNSVDVNDLDIGVLTVPPNIMLREDIEEMVRAITAAGGFDYLVLDTYAQVTPGANENSAEDMGLALSNCRAICEATGAMVILIHHSGKDASKGARGWSGINAALDFSLEVTRDDTGEYREIRLAKMKDGEDGLKYGFKLGVVPVGFDEDGDEVTSCVIENMELPSKAIEANGSKRRNRMQNHVLEIMTLFGSNDTVSLQVLVDRAVEMLPKPEGGERDTRRQSVVRAVHALSREKDGPLKLAGNVVIFYE